MISQTIIRSFRRVGGNKVKNDGNAKMVVVFTYREMSYLVVGLLNGLVHPLSCVSNTLSLFAMNLFSLIQQQ